MDGINPMDFKTQPPEIPTKDIKEVKNTDVVVVGAGIAGLTAALSSVEAGAKTIVLEKGPTYSVRGLHNAAINSRLQKSQGIKIDKDALISTIMEFSAYRADQRIVKLWADNCDQVMDWLLDMAEKDGIEVILDTTTKSWYFPNYPLIHVFLPKRQETLAEMLLSHGQKQGVDYYFRTSAVRLLTEKRGRVSGLIARTEDGNYLRINTKKAVVLCTGDYGGDRNMVEKYCWPGISELKCTYLPQYDPQLNTGDGHKMGMWVGAAIDDPPHCAMLWDFAVWSEKGLFNLARQPWLYVNSNGERFMNEDLPWGYECAQILQQPNRSAWSIWDSKYEQEIPTMHSQCCKNMGPPTFLWDPIQLEEALQKRNVLKANSVDELSKKNGGTQQSFSSYRS